jgi:hypothetical protein
MKKHKFSSTRISLFHDGSAEVHHIHESDPKKDVRHAVSDLDGVHDSFQEHLNPEEIEDKLESEGKDPEALEEKVSPGIHQKILELGKE